VNRVLGFILVFCSALFSSISNSANVPSQAQIEMFSQLPAAQQKALAKQYGIDLSTIPNPQQKSKTLYPSLNELVPPRNEQAQKKTVNTLLVGDENTLLVGDENKLVSQFEQNNTSIELKPFGYELFSGEPSTFAPVTDVPVPDEYILGPGDIIRIQLYGKKSENLSLTVNRRGAIELPSLGPYQVAGQSFSSVSAQIQSNVKERMIGVKSNVSMGALRSIKVFVLGEAYKPASYTLSSLSTVTQALYAAGGINTIGSLRNIQIKRRGKVIAKLDLYDLLLEGDTSGDTRLLAGDVVFIPTVGKTVSVKGDVIRPAIYELNGVESLNNVLAIAGGLLPTAYEKIVKLERININGLRSIINIDLASKEKQLITNGDIIEVASALNTLEKNVVIKGHVARPGIFGWKENMQLSHILADIKDFKKQADLEYILVARSDPISGELTTFAVNYLDYIVHGRKESDFLLNSQDIVYVFNKERNRTFSLEPILKRLKDQTRFLEPPKVVTIVGAVKNPGSYPLSHNANIVDVLRAAMGYEQGAELEFVLIAHTNPVNYQTEIQYLNLTNEKEKFNKLAPLDRIFVFNRSKPREKLLETLIIELKKQANKAYAQNVVTIIGDVRFPGEYPYVVENSAEQLINLAGGFNESSYLIDAELTRFNHDGIENASIEHEIIDLANTEFKLKPLDTLFIKRIPKWRDKRSVKISGEVIFPGNYVIEHSETLAQVIQRAGGFTHDADLRAAIFTRETLRQKEQKQIARLSNELKSEITALKIDKSENTQDISVEEAELLSKRLESVTAIGRLVIDLPNLLTTSESDMSSVRLDDKDALYIPKKQQSISVLGEVQYPTSHLFSSDIDIDDYIDKSGGKKIKADEDRIYIVKSDGSVYMPKNANWFASSQGLSPGDTIIVPLDTGYRDDLSLWSTATGILYNTAVAVAAVGSL
jgi:polysaccharide export outer membrane protein